MIFTVVLIGFLSIINALAESTCSVNSLHDTTCPIGELIVETNDKNLKLSKLNCDELYKREDFLTKPFVKYLTAKTDSLYTLVMADPDAVNIKPKTHVLHWMVANIKGSDFINGDFNGALMVKDYHPPSPPVNSGIHRYQFTVYTQDKKLFGTVAHENRANFLLESWLESTGQSLCGPVAGVQFRVKAATTSDIDP